MCVLLYSLIVLINAQDDSNGCESTWNDELPHPRGSLATIYLRMLQNKPIMSFDKTIVIHNTRQTYSNSIYLNSVCHLISYTRLFTKLNLVEILLYVTFFNNEIFLIYSSRRLISHMTKNQLFTVQLHFNTSSVYI